jgi:hypothetical protein
MTKTLRTTARVPLTLAPSRQFRSSVDAMNDRAKGAPMRNFWEVGPRCPPKGRPSGDRASEAVFRMK